MRIVAIGLGGAGCRIVDSLYAIDRRSSRVACIEGLVVDVDEATLQHLTGIPDSLKMYYPPFDPTSPESMDHGGATATIDIAEIISRIHNFESGENDAILICCGLGGRMADIVPHIITGLRSTIVEPIFGLVTLPCLAEGQKRSAKAADDIDILSPLLDGIIVFDNETWYKKTRAAAQARLTKKEKGLAQMLGIGKPEPEISPEMATYQLLNEAIVRRISLILKAGEFRADGGIDLAEVVLDSGEVLNTMKGGGFITIGYAVEHLPSNPLAFLSQLKPAGLFNEESKKRASRIVELAKQAIYNEVSTPCDMTSAHKALVLIAGPSHELSMQGFMTVRKWIDRSIRGLETRSGDYPVMNTKIVAIIVMLSGLENIPRINELREIREQVRQGPVRRELLEDVDQTTTGVQHGSALLRDEMIVLPTTMQRATESPQKRREETPRSRRPMMSETGAGPTTGTYESRSHAHQPPPTPEQRVQHSHQQSPLRDPQREQARFDPATTLSRVSPHQRDSPQDQNIPTKRLPAQQPISQEPAGYNNPVPKSVPVTHSKEQARQRIEQELQRQRMKALSGTQKTGEREITSQITPSAIIKPKRVVVSQDSPAHPVTSSRQVDEGILQASVKKTVIIRKRSHAPSDDPQTHSSDASEEVSVVIENPRVPHVTPEENVPVPQADEESVLVKDPEYRAKDEVFSGRTVKGTAVPKARDASLMHTSLKPKKHEAQIDNDTRLADVSNREEESMAEQQHEKKTKKKDDISWI